MNGRPHENKPPALTALEQCYSTQSELREERERVEQLYQEFQTALYGDVREIRELPKHTSHSTLWRGRFLRAAALYECQLATVIAIHDSYRVECPRGQLAEESFRLHEAIAFAREQWRLGLEPRVFHPASGYAIRFLGDGEPFRICTWERYGR